MDFGNRYGRCGREQFYPGRKSDYEMSDVAPVTCEIIDRRLNKSNEMQQYAFIYLLLNYSACFGRPSRPSSGVRKTVVAASGTDHTIWGASFLKRDQIRTGQV